MTTISKVELEIDCENAAFEGDPTHEVARILRKAADRIEREGKRCSGFKLMDVNGNSVGELSVNELWTSPA